MKSKICVFGGTFNPVHNGHIHLLERCDEHYNFDKILIVPSMIPPHKQTQMVDSFEHRYNMLKLVFGGKQRHEISDIEQKLEGVSYTINTIMELKKQYEDYEFHFIMGSDMLLYFDKWYEYEKLLEQTKIVCGARDEDEYEKMATYKRDKLGNNKNVEIVEFSPLAITSTEVRNGEKHELIPDAVKQYIKRNNLYEKT